MQRPPQHVQVPQQPQHEAATPTAASWHSPRPAKHRPPSLVLESSNGASSLDVKQQICDTRIEAPPTLTQVPPDKRQPLPPTPTTPFAAGGMGNKPSSVSGSPIPDDHSARSVVRQRDARQPVSRKSSFNLFKRVDSKSPLPRDVTASVMSILHRDGHKKEDSCTTDDDGLEAVPADPFFDQPHLNDGRYPDVYPKVHSASTMTMTDERAGLPLSASTTIRDCRSTDQSPMQNPQTDGTSEQKDLPPLPADDTDALSPLSPTIPAPSPLPEDSPHKYGLRDKIDTPEVPQVPEEVNANKMRRKSSGLEIFNVSHCRPIQDAPPNEHPGSEKPAIRTIFPQRPEYCSASSRISFRGAINRPFGFVLYACCWLNIETIIHPSVLIKTAVDVPRLRGASKRPQLQVIRICLYSTPYTCADQMLPWTCTVTAQQQQACASRVLRVPH